MSERCVSSRVSSRVNGDRVNGDRVNNSQVYGQGQVMFIREPCYTVIGCVVCRVTARTSDHVMYRLIDRINRPAFKRNECVVCESVFYFTVF